MIFRPDLAEKVLAGEKTQTRRLVSDNPNSPWWRERCMYKAGGVYAVQPGRGKTSIGKLRVREVRQELLWTMLEFEARAEGFASLAEFNEAWVAINGAYDGNALVWALTFEVVRAIHVLDPRAGFQKSMCDEPINLAVDSGVYVHWIYAEHATCDACKTEAATR